MSDATAPQGPNPSPPQPNDTPNLVIDDQTASDRLVREDLDRLRMESLLARQDTSAELARDIERAAQQPLALSELAGVLDRVAPETQEFLDLQEAMAAPDVGALGIDKDVLTDLLRDGADAQAILKKGLVFVKHRRYPQAVEWWTLHRRDLDAATSRLYLLLLIMESLTWLWAGNTSRAAAVRDQVAAHPLYRRAHGGVAKGSTTIDRT